MSKKYFIDEIEAKFLRHRPTKQFSGFIYAFPEVPDVCNFSSDQVVGEVLPLDDTSVIL